MNKPETVYLVNYLSGYMALQSGNGGEYFYNQYDEVRRFKAPGDARRFLRDTGFAWVMEHQGKMHYINCDPPDGKSESTDQYGDHDWNKTNLFTLSSKGGGTYDLYRCSFCSAEYKRTGFDWNPPQGPCKKHSLDTKGEIQMAKKQETPEPVVEAVKTPKAEAGLNCPVCGKHLAFIEYGEKPGKDGRVARWPIFEKCDKLGEGHTKPKPPRPPSKAFTPQLLIDQPIQLVAGKNNPQGLLFTMAKINKASLIAARDQVVQANQFKLHGTIQMNTTALWTFSTEDAEELAAMDIALEPNDLIVDNTANDLQTIFVRVK